MKRNRLSQRPQPLTVSPANFSTLPITARRYQILVVCIIDKCPERRRFLQLSHGIILTAVDAAPFQLLPGRKVVCVVEHVHL